MSEQTPFQTKPRTLAGLRHLLSPWAAGIPALVVYVLTISRTAYPGLSAAHIASAADLMPESLSAHPVWSLLTGWLAHATLLSLPLRLNLFSAACAAASVGMMGMIMEAWLFRTAREQQDGTIQPMRPEEEDADEPQPAPSAPAVSPFPTAADHAAAMAARLGGWTAALALAFSVPFWSVATRLHFQTFDVLLLLTAVYALQMHAANPSPLRALAVAALCGLGCVESAIFIPLSPLLFILLLRNRLLAEEPWEGQMAASLVLAVVSASAGLLLLWSLRTMAAGEPLTLRTVLLELLRGHLALLRHALPASGWVWVLLLAFTPAVVMLLAAKGAFGERAYSTIGMHGAMTGSAAWCLFNAPLSPWGLARSGDALPVIPYLAVAATTGYLIAYWRMLGVPPDRPEDVAEDADLEPLPGLSPRLAAGLGWACGCPLATCVVVAACLNLGAADGRRGAFVDTLARDVLGRLGSRTWVVSDGRLDNHLLIVAHEQQQRLRLVSMGDGTDNVRQRRLRTLIDSEPSFAARRTRLYNALSLGPMTFVQEWIAGDPEAANRLLVVGAPEVWTMAGYRPVPVGFGCDGTRDLEPLRARNLLGPNRDYWQSMAKLLAPGDALPVAPARVRTVLRRTAGLGANNLGVLLEDLARPEEACEAYEAALRIDPRNLSALLNLHALALGGTRADTRKAMERRLTERVTREKQLPPIEVIVHAYGDIRQPGVLSRQGLAWAQAGQPEMARTELMRALALAPTNTDVQCQLGNLALQQADAAESERAYRAVLAARPNDTAALAGLASVALGRGRPDEARAWLERARLAGAPASALAIPTAAMLVASGRTDEALANLRALTDDNAGNLEAWSLMADLLLRQKQTDEVELRVLPAMVKAAGRSDHVLVHLVRASLLRARQPVDFLAVRTSLLCALRLRPDLASIRDDLLALDFAWGDPDASERDAAEVLRTAPDHAFANYLLASVLLGRGDLSRAEDLFRRSLASHPTFMAHNDLAETLRRRRQFALAEQSARAALALNSQSYAAWDTLGCILLDAGRLDEAAEAVARSLALHATDPRTHLSLARVRLAQGRPTEAREILKQPVLRSAHLPPDLQRQIAALDGQLGAR